MLALALLAATLATAPVLAASATPRVMGVGPGLFALIVVFVVGAVAFVATRHWFPRLSPIVFLAVVGLEVVLVLVFVLSPHKKPGEADTQGPADEYDHTMAPRIVVGIVLFLMVVLSCCCLNSISAMTGIEQADADTPRAAQRSPPPQRPPSPEPMDTNDNRAPAAMIAEALALSSDLRGAISRLGQAQPKLVQRCAVAKNEAERNMTLLGAEVAMRNMRMTLRRELWAARRIFDEHYLSPADLFGCLDLIAAQPPRPAFLPGGPGPHAVVKGQALTFGLKLIHSPSIALFETQPVSTATVFLDREAKIKAKKSFSVPSDFCAHQSQALDLTLKSLSMTVRFTTGSNMRPASLIFRAPVSYVRSDGCCPAPLHTTVESEPCEPLTCISNSFQWHTSECDLFLCDLFGSRISVSWERLCNVLQLHYLWATKQGRGEVERPLTTRDFEYLRRKFECQTGTRLRRDCGMRVWDWIGAAVEKVRHQKHLGRLWCDGVVFGMISKSDSEAVLEGRPCGTALLRLSECFPGRYALAVVAESGVRHVLLRDTDLTGSRRSILEHLLEMPGIRTVVLNTTAFEGEQEVAVQSWAEVRAMYFGDHPGTTAVAGYDDVPAWGGPIEEENRNLSPLPPTPSDDDPM
eukprot:m51a1_g2024 hypothetical protein (635) ;mRNA; f:1294812-1297482